MTFAPLEAAAQMFVDARTVAFWRYFSGRRLGREILDYFRIGLSPSWPLLQRPVRWRRAFTDAGFFDADSGQPMWKYLNRYTFPLQDASQQVVGFAFRDTGHPMPERMMARPGTPVPATPQAERKRYDNLNNRSSMPWAPGFVSQPTLYGLPDVGARKDLVLVEGPVDCMRCISAGHPEVAAVLGVSRVQERALELLQDAQRTVTLFLDSDQAARLAAVRICAMWLEGRRTWPGKLRVAVIPSSWEADDPGELEDTQIDRALRECVLTGEEYLKEWPGRGIDPEDPWQVHVFSQWLRSMTEPSGVRA